MPRAHLKAALARHLSTRLADALSTRIGLGRELGTCSDAELSGVADIMAALRFPPTGTKGYAKAEVTAGGISTMGLSSKTIEARDVPGLYAVGEAVDVTGWLGGYNFQWPWSSGFAAGRAVAERTAGISWAATGPELTFAYHSPPSIVAPHCRHSLPVHVLANGRFIP